MSEQGTLAHVTQVFKQWPKLEAFKLFGNNGWLRPQLSTIELTGYYTTTCTHPSDCPSTPELATVFVDYIRSNPHLRLLELSGTRGGQPSPQLQLPVAASLTTRV